MTAELSVRLEAGIADILRAERSLPHQINPPFTWRALDYLAAVRLGAWLWFSDGRALWSGADDVWRFSDHPDIARVIVEHGDPPGEAVQAVPRAFPIGAVGRDTMLWVLRWYDTDHEYVCTPIVLDAARREVRVLRARGRRIGGTAPRRVLATDDPHRFVITGQVDAGAMAHIDDFIMVDVAWEVDLTSDTYHDTNEAAGQPTEGLVAVSHQQVLSHDGLDYHLQTTRRGAGRSTFTVRDHDDVLTLELHTTGHATVRVGRAPVSTV